MLASSVSNLNQLNSSKFSTEAFYTVSNRNILYVRPEVTAFRIIQAGLHITRIIVINIRSDFQQVFQKFGALLKIFEVRVLIKTAGLLVFKIIAAHEPNRLPISFAVLSISLPPELIAMFADISPRTMIDQLPFCLAQHRGLG